MRIRHSLGQLIRFAWTEAVCCAFAVAIFLGLGVTGVLWNLVDMPVARYDALLAYVVIVQIGFVVTRLETPRELLVIGAFHLVGLALEIYKVHMGSWSYPDAGVAKVAGVPIFSGFMYAAVGSYICQAFRRFDLRMIGYRPLPVTVLGVAAYGNFWTHHVLPDMRGWIAAGLLIATYGTWVRFTVGLRRYRMPLALAFTLIGTALWVAENIATFLGAWKYPDQLAAWRMVHVGKLGSWSLLVVLSFVLVTAVKAYEGRLTTTEPYRINLRVSEPEGPRPTALVRSPSARPDNGTGRVSTSRWEGCVKRRQLSSIRS
jgi:uncharacterized membrane protein YoaT (DUF817 family)